MEATYEATTITGLERLARDECEEKLGCSAECQLGRIFFKTARPVADLVKLKCINNVYVIIKDVTLDEQPKDAGELGTMLDNICADADWSRGLLKWREASNFSPEISMETILSEDSDNQMTKPRFRVSCYRHGDHFFTSPEAASMLGSSINRRFKWPVKLKEFNVEVTLTYNENHVYVAIVLTPDSLCRRNIVATGMTTLRSPTCYAMLRLANLQCGDIVTDPMAGTSAIPVECCDNWGSQVFSLAGELSKKSIRKSQKNLKNYSMYPNDLVNLDVRRMPFRDNCIDVFISDIPFGRRHGSKYINQSLYPALFKEMTRCAVRETGRAVLLTADKRSFHNAMFHLRDYWHLMKTNFVKIGNICSWIYCLRRTESLYFNVVKKETSPQPEKPNEQ